MEQDTRIKLGRLQMEDCGQGGNVPELSAIKVPAVGEVAGDGGGRGGCSWRQCDKGLGLGVQSL